MRRFFLLFFLYSSFLSAIELPTMGWSSWNTYRINISDSLIMRQADAIVSQGLHDVGYTYINIDDGFFGGRDPQTGRLLIHPTRFPRGLQPVVSHILSLGLKAGIYSDAGANTCGNWYDKDSMQEGEYNVTIRCSSFDNKATLFVSTNNGKGQRFKSDDLRDGSVRLTLNLNKGQNTIRLYNDNGPMPDIDYMQIDF